MLPEITPILNEPALAVTNTETALVIADLHLGIEWDLYRSGINLPSRMKERLIRIEGYIEETTPARIVLLGDVKHNVPQVSWQERDEIPRFLEALAAYAPVDILPGNHDGGIELLFNRNAGIRVHSAKGAVLDGIGYFHGHTWPAPELLGVRSVVTAHNHPTVRFTDSFGYSTNDPAWIRTRFNPEVLREHFKNLDFNDKTAWANPEVFIVPAFNELCGGVPFNESTCEDLLGPAFSSGSIELDSAEVYLLDGTRLGLVKNIRKLEHTRPRPKPKPKPGKRGRSRKNPNEGSDLKRD